MSHRLHKLLLQPVFPSSWAGMPSQSSIKQQISLAVLADSELSSTALGFYTPPKRVREVILSSAAFDQIRSMWHGHRAASSISPPTIPLTYFVIGFGQSPPDSWVDIEVLPGLENWEPGDA